MKSRDAIILLDAESTIRLVAVAGHTMQARTGYGRRWQIFMPVFHARQFRSCKAAAYGRIRT